MQLRKCLGIDIGNSSVKIAEVVAEKSGARVTKLVQAELSLPPGPMDSERVNAVTRAIRDLMREHRMTAKHAVFCVPGQTVFMRRIKVPRTTEERLHRIVAYEARQQIPFALDNSLMEYQVFDFGEGTEVEVLLVAIKKDIVNDFMRIVSRTGLKPVMISVSSLALFNFHVFESSPYEEFAAELNAVHGKMAGARGGKGRRAGKKAFALSFGGLGLGKSKGGTATAEIGEDEGGEEVEASFEDVYEEVRAYVNVGAQTFDLTIGRFGKHKMLGFTRSVPWAGNELTRSLQEKLGLNSSADAERMKRESAIVIVPGREDETMDGGVDPEASEFATTWADRLILDLRKSFDYYISQPDGMAVDTILLSGGQALQKNFSDYVEDKLGIPVDTKRQVENQALRIPDMDDQSGVASYLIAMGLGLTGVGMGHITIDFLPPELKTIREFKKKNVEVSLLIGAIVGMVGFSTQVGNKRSENMNEWLRRNETQIANINQTKKQLEDVRTDNKVISGKYDSLLQATGERSFWLEFMGVIESVKPGDILITSMMMAYDGRVEMMCETEVIGSISAFAEGLRKQAEWIESVDLSSPEPRISQFIRKEVYGFTLRLRVKSKQTRLALARVTLPPGVTAATPAATGGRGPGAKSFAAPPPPAGGPPPAGPPQGELNDERVR